MTHQLTGYSNPAYALGMCYIDSTRFSQSNDGWGLVRVTGLTFPGREHWASLRVEREEVR